MTAATTVVIRRQIDQPTLGAFYLVHTSNLYTQESGDISSIVERLGKVLSTSFNTLNVAVVLHARIREFSNHKL